MRLSRLFPAGRRPPALAALPIVVLINAVLALLAPLGAAEEPLVRVGVLLALTGGLEALHSVRRAESEALYRGVASGATTILMGLVVVSAPFLVGTALLLLLAISFAVDGLGYVRVAWRARGEARTFAVLGAAGDLGAAVLLLLTSRLSLTWVVSVAAALRMAGVAWTMAVTPVLSPEDARQTVLDDLGLADRPDAVALAAAVATEETARAPSDRRWTLAFLVSLFAIHSARIQGDGTLLGLASPAIAVIGDMALAILFTLVVIVPIVVSARTSTRWLERLVWRWYLSAGSSAAHWRHTLASIWLRYRLRIGMRLREAQYSVPAALWRSLSTGLPVAAIIAATVPVWGMSWFFDTENWASGIWNSWAEARTDRWREAMGVAVAGGAAAAPTTFAVAPPDVQGGNFSFIVIGDIGEGDASQHVLRDQLLSVAARDDVRFVMISSDVVYPNGAMKDYEAKFWLPFKGVAKPVYAIPGNHDWYDALEGFLATFLEPEAARLSMRARAETDLRLTSTTESRIDRLIGEAQRLRTEYQVPTGFQRAPYFEVQTDRFALLAIDTGIVKRIDDAQRVWLESALERAQGKTTMAVLGHPFFAGGHDQASGHEDFTSLKRLLLARGVTILMAGDTHDLEYYAEPSTDATPTAHYFVNGGGGAYLSFGTSLQWPDQPATSEWAFYPNRAAVVNKLEFRTPWYKRPAWWWTHNFNAWPFSSEWLSALFDYNVAPFFQSFFEVRVEPSAGRIVLVPYGVHGRLRWSDLGHSPSLRGVSRESDFAEWTVPMR
jgi:uncharacterized membrane protein HdeD (DUF308 family)/3',5'-cyclic AMP phosphodiesterase CpdA